jgi:hypothetical protein
MTSSWSAIPFDEVADFNALDRCITRGMPASMFPFMYNSGIEIMQSPGVVAIRLELVHETRIVPVDGRPPLAPEVVQWLGESRGRFDFGPECGPKADGEKCGDFTDARSCRPRCFPPGP